MRASTGQYFVGLDHVRALAAFLVFSWHFMHIPDGHVTPLAGTFDFPLFSIFAEGHTGVSLFMVLSGYLFAKITAGRSLDYGRFLAARAWRLLPMLLSVMGLLVVLAYFRQSPEVARDMVRDVLNGIWLPSLPFGGWSITVEVHFYLLFPLILALERRRPWASLVVLFSAMAIRFGLYQQHLPGGFRDFAYWTILGRIDQFIIGILLARHGETILRGHLAGIVGAVGALGYFAWFDRAGGFNGIDLGSVIWVFQWTIEGFFYGLLILWYDRSFRMPQTGASGLLAQAGAASYSIYLLHGFFVFRMAEWVDEEIVPLTNIYIALAASFLCFLPVAGIGWLSYRYYERFWLRFRRTYSAPATES